MISIKQCKTCGLEKELSEFYSQNKIGKDGVRWIYYPPECKECTKKRSMASRNKDHDAYLQYMVERRLGNKKEDNAISRKWYRDNIESWKVYRKQYAVDNGDKMREYSKNRIKKNHKLSKKEWFECKAYFNNSCAYCELTWGEHKRLYNEDLHKEHADDDGANNLSNCVPSCRICNSEKNAKHYNDWYKVGNERFLTSRLEKIEKWLQSDYLLYIKKDKVKTQ